MPIVMVDKVWWFDCVGVALTDALVPVFVINLCLTSVEKSKKMLEEHANFNNL